MNTAIQDLEALHATKEGGSFKTVAEEVAAGIAGANLDQYVDDTTFEAYQTDIAGAIADAKTALQKADITEGVSNGTIAVEGTDVKVHGLKSAAYTLSTDYATAAQGAAADSAVQSTSFAGTAMTKTGTALSISQADARSALGLGTAAYKADTYFGTAAAVSANATAISNMDAEYAEAKDGGVMTAITQVDGKITSVTQRKIKPTDISNDSDDVFVFYCGNASGYDANFSIT
jgi:hypothetical protein